VSDVYPKVWDSEGTIATIQADASTYLSASSLPLEPVLAIRAGVRRSWGPYPWFEAAYVGGKSTLRGYDHDRFAGDAAVYTGAELRVRLFHFGGPLPGDLGGLALADAGRVWLHGEQSDRWHTAWGGGLWISVIDRSAILTTTLAKGSERTALYLGLGFAF
jgi:hemolysin activation/secretion protein